MKYSAFFAAYNASVKAGNPNSKEEQIAAFTGGRTESLKELSGQELAELVRSLNDLSGFKPIKEPKDAQRDRMRKSIIAIFKKMHKTTEDAIAWAEAQGVKKVKREFNDYSAAELYVLIRVAEKIHADWQDALRKSMLKYEK